MRLIGLVDATPKNPGIKISSTNGVDNFEIHLLSSDMGVFNDTPQDALIQKKMGEELVAALLDHCRKEKVYVQVIRTKNGLRNDGIGGEPSVEVIDVDGFRWHERHHKNGELHNGINGEEAFREFYNISKPSLIASFENGKLEDRKDGKPAQETFFEDGSIHSQKNSSNGIVSREVKFYKSGGLELQLLYNEKGNQEDGPDGDPGFLWYNGDGVVISARSYKDGHQVSQLSDTEKMKYNIPPTQTKNAITSNFFDLTAKENSPPSLNINPVKKFRYPSSS